MKYTLSFLEKDFEELNAHFLRKKDVEQAAYLLCKMSKSDNETRLLVREIIPVQDEDILEASSTHMKIDPQSYLRAIKKANDTKQGFIFVHSHPNGLENHSKQDDIEEEKLFNTAYTRIHNDLIHGSLVFPNSKKIVGRVWLSDNSNKPIECIRIIGRRFQFHYSNDVNKDLPNFYDRQVRAFGKDIQLLLSQLKVGVIGAGGTGSIVTEQLIRLGVGSILVSDGDLFDETNVNRVYGSRIIDNRLPKTKIMKRLAADIGLDTKIEVLPQPITFESIAKKLRECDMIFGCTDDEWGRSIFNRLVYYYYIPVFDMGVKIDSENGSINSIQGRVTTLIPSSACLYCRGRISADQVRNESMKVLDPSRLEELQKEGYVPELESSAPAIIPFTTAIGASAISEFLHRLTGYKGKKRNSTEVIHLFDDTRIRTNSRKSSDDCLCNDNFYLGRGDTSPFLDITWRSDEAL